MLAGVLLQSTVAEPHAETQPVTESA